MVYLSRATGSMKSASIVAAVLFATSTFAAAVKSPPPSHAPSHAPSHPPSHGPSHTKSANKAEQTAVKPKGGVPKQCQHDKEPDASCFNALDLPDYIMDWWKINEKKCEEYHGFADCWYAKMTPYSPSKCAQLNTDPACSQPYWKDFKGFNDVQNFYVTWCIWNTQGLFLDIYNAVGAASKPAGDQIGKLVTTLDPPKHGKDKKAAFFEAMTFGLSLYSEGATFFKALLRSLPQSSTLVYRHMFPQGDISGDVVAWADVAGELGDWTKTWQKSIGEGLPVVQNNISAFIPLHQGTPLSGARPPLDKLTESIGQSLSAYVASGILNELEWAVTRAENMDVKSFQAKKGKDLWWDTGCKAYDKHGICGGFYYDGKDTYSIVNPKKMTKDQGDILGKLIGGDDPFTTGKLLFTDGYQCAKSCGKNGGCKPKADEQDPTKVSCISTARICTYTWDSYGPFKDCDNLPKKSAVLDRFGVTSCKGEEDGTSVPYTYLGGGIMKKGAPQKWEYQTGEVCHSEYE